MTDELGSIAVQGSTVEVTFLSLSHPYEAQPKMQIARARAAPQGSTVEKPIVP